MRITQVMLTRAFGGAERYYVDLCLELANRGHEIQAIYHGDFVNKSLLEHPNITRSPIKLKNPKNWFRQVQAYKRIKAFNPQLIHSHLGKASELCRLSVKKLKLPLVCKAQNHLEMRRFGAVTHFIATTESLSQYLMEKEVDPDNISIIPNFSNLIPNPKCFDHESNAPRFITLGRLDPLKGFDLLLEAFARYLAKGGEGTLTIGGEGDIKAHLIAMASQLGITDKVDFYGWVSERQPFLHSGDCFILSSRSETFGIVLLEAMAMGLPIISTKAMGPSQVLNDDIATLVPTNNVEALANAMKDYSCNRASYHARATKALDFYKANYTKDQVIPKIMSLYERLGSIDNR